MVPSARRLRAHAAMRMMHRHAMSPLPLPHAVLAYRASMCHPRRIAPARPYTRSARDLVCSIARRELPHLRTSAVALVGTCLGSGLIHVCLPHACVDIRVAAAGVEVTGLRVAERDRAAAFARAACLQDSISDSGFPSLYITAANSATAHAAKNHTFPSQHPILTTCLTATTHSFFPGHILSRKNRFSVRIDS